MSESGNSSRQKRSNPPRQKRGGGNPRRGSPGVLLTCERGREAKCKREGLEILQYYLSNQSSLNQSEEKEKELTLEQEIAMLQKGATSDQVLDGKQQEELSNAFQVYETGCGGTVFVMCTLKGNMLIPPVRTEWKEANDAKRKAPEDDEDGAKKRARLEGGIVEAEKQNRSTEEENEKKNYVKPESSDEKGTEAESEAAPPWDPVETVQRVLQDLDSASKTAPSSRFVTRMIPIQATCFPSIEEIGLTAKALVEKYLQSSPCSTFAVRVKRRNCSTATRDEIIEAVAGQVVGSNNEWKVDLKSPEYTIVVEICKTLCGMAIVKDCASFRNFNLLEIRQAKENKDVDD